MIQRKGIIKAVVCWAFLLLPVAGKAQVDTTIGTHARAESDALYYDATKARINGDAAKAIMLLQQFVALKPDVGTAYYDLSRLYAEQKNTDAAFTNIKKAISLSDNRWYREEYAIILVMRNQYEDAAAEYSKLSKEISYNDEYLTRASLLYQRTGKYDEALKLLNQLDKKNGPDEDVILQEEQIYLKKNDVEGAAKSVRQLIALDPQEARYYLLLAEVYENNKKPEEAAKVYAELQQKFPDNPGVQLSAANQALQKGDSAKYNELLQKAITNKDLDVESQIKLLFGYAQESNLTPTRKAELLEMARKVAVQRPNDVEVLSLYGGILMLNDNKADAIEQYKKAVTIDPGKFAIWQQLLYSYTAKSDADSLIKYSEKAARLYPNQALVHFLNGVGHSNKGEYPQAIKAITRAIDLQPEEDTQLVAEMYTSLGDAYNYDKQYVNSDSSYEKAIRLNPKNASALNNYAYYLSVRGVRLDEAARMSKASLDLQKGEPTFLDTYGWILYKQGKYAEALTNIQLAVDKGGGDSDGAVLEHLGDVLFKLNKLDDAVATWKRARAKGAENPQQLDKKIADRKLYE